MAPHLDLRIVGHGRPRLVHPLAVDEHQTGHDVGLCLLAAVQQSLFHKQDIQPCFLAHASTSFTAHTTPWASSPSAWYSCLTLPWAGRRSPAFSSRSFSGAAPRSSSSAARR